MKKRILWLAVDLAVATLIVLAVWILNYKIPQGGIKAVTFHELETDSRSGAKSGRQIETQQGSFIATNIVIDTQDWHEKYADKFTNTVVETDTSYTSPDLSLQLSYRHYDTGILDSSDGGKHVSQSRGRSRGRGASRSRGASSRGRTGASRSRKRSRFAGLCGYLFCYEAKRRGKSI